MSAPQTSKKNRLSRGPYCLPKLHEMVLPEATTNITAPNAVPKQNENKNIPMAQPSAKSEYRQTPMGPIY